VSHIQIQLARGTTAQLATYTGPVGEINVNTDDWSLVVQDGSTAGGARSFGSLAMLADGLPLMDGTAFRGSNNNAARSDHIHPTDTTRAPLTNPVFLGGVTLPGDPTSALQAATKRYVDNLSSGLNIKSSTKAATTANITLSGAQTIDGISIVATDRVLVKNQTTTADNGIYVAAAGAWSRSTDMDAWTEVPGANVWVEQGTVNANRSYVCTSTAGGTLGSTAITWSLFGGSGVFAPIDSPALTGVPTSTTPGTSDNTTKIATTAFVKAQNYVTGGPYLALTGGQLTGAVTNAGSLPASVYSGSILTVDLSVGNIGFNLHVNSAATQWLHTSGSGSGALFTYDTTNNKFIWYQVGAGAVGTAVPAFNTLAQLNNAGNLALYSVSAAGAVDTPIYYTNGSGLASSNTSYNFFYDRSSSIALLLGGTGSSTNYYRNSTHVFGLRDGASDHSYIGSSGEIVSNSYYSNIGRIITRGVNNPSLCVYNQAAGSARGWFMAADASFYFGSMDGAGNYVGGTGMQFNVNNWMTVYGLGISYLTMAYGSANWIAFGWGTYPGFPGHVAVSVDNGGAAYPISSASDARLKTNINNSTFDNLRMLNSISLKEFRWADISHPTKLKEAKENTNFDMKRVGVIAQQVYEIFPEGVVEGDDFEHKLGRVWTLDHNVMIAALIGGIQQLTERIEKLEE